MDDALLVGRFEGFGDLLGDGEGFVDRDGPLLDAICQRRPLDQFEDQRSDAVSLLQPVDAADVWVVQRGEDLGFALEASQAVRVGRERLGQHLQRHVPVELRVAGLPDFTHTAFADLGGDGVRAEGRSRLKWHQLLRLPILYERYGSCRRLLRQRVEQESAIGSQVVHPAVLRRAAADDPRRKQGRWRANVQLSAAGRD